MKHIYCATLVGALAAGSALASREGDCDAAYRLGKAEGQQIYAGITLDGEACTRLSAAPDALFLEALTIREDLLLQGEFSAVPGLENAQDCRLPGQLIGIGAADRAQRVACERTGE